MTVKNEAGLFDGKLFYQLSTLAALYIILMIGSFMISADQARLHDSNTEIINAFSLQRLFIARYSHYALLAITARQTDDNLYKQNHDFAQQDARRISTTYNSLLNGGPVTLTAAGNLQMYIAPIPENYTRGRIENALENWKIFYQKNLLLLNKKSEDYYPAEKLNERLFYMLQVQDEAASAIIKFLKEKNQRYFFYQKIFFGAEIAAFLFFLFYARFYALQNIKKINLELRRSRKNLERLGLVSNTTSDAIIISDQNGLIEWVNPAFTELTGYTLEEVKGLKPGSFLIGPKTNRKISKEMGKAIRNGLPFAGEIINYKKRGQEYWLDIRIHPVKNDKGRIERFIAVERDITSRKTADRELEKYRTHLEELVDRQTRNLALAKEEAEAANRAKDDFLANMSHELRTPLNSIIGLTKMLLSESQLEPSLKEDLEIINKSSASLLNTVNDLLDLSKIEAGHIELEHQPFNLFDVLSSLIGQVSPLAGEKGLSLNHDIENLTGVVLVGDEFRLSRIILNLLSNALKFTPMGQIDICASVIPAQSAEFSSQCTLVCSVRDTGIGISADKLGHIFEKFIQAEDTVEKTYGGTGLGLCISKQLVELMGGTIKVESTPGEGSTFTVKVPFEKIANDSRLNKDHEFLINKIKIPPFDQRKNIKDSWIVIAEDHEFNQAFIVKLIKKLGCRNYMLVENGKELLQILDHYPFDLILMDIHMPILNGYETARSIKKRNDGGNHIPIIAMTADVMPETRQQCLDTGMNAYIGKPFDGDELKTLLAHWFVLDNTKRNGDHKQDRTINLALLEEYAGGDLVIEKDMIAKFYNKSKEHLQKMGYSLTMTGYADWNEAAHALKGSAAYLGADNLVNLCRQAQNIKNATASERKTLLAAMVREHENICHYLRTKGLLTQASGPGD